jgi:hypothetical protein
VPPRDEPHLDPELIALLALGETPGTAEEGAAARRHLERCPTCRAEVDELSVVSRQARLVTPGDTLVPPPPAVWDAVAAEVGRSAVAPPSAVPAPRRRISWLATAAAACVGLVVGGGATYAVTAAQRDAAPPTIVAEASLAPLPGATATGSAEVVTTASGPRVLVDVTGLAAPDGYYEVWLLDPQGNRLVALGALDGSSRGSFAMPAGVAMSDYPVVDVSLEPPDGNPDHSHHSLVRGTLRA